MCNRILTFSIGRDKAEHGATDTPVAKALYTKGTVASTLVHQVTSVASGYVHGILDRVARAVESHRQVTSARVAILAFVVRPHQRLLLLV